MIRQVSFRNFKALRHVDVELEPLTVIVGPNASGKTSILEGLHYIVQLHDIPALDLFRGPLNPLLLYSRNATGMMQLSYSAPNGEFRFRATPPPDASLDVLDPGTPYSHLSAWAPEVAMRLAHQENGWTPHQLAAPTPAAGLLAPLLRLNPERLAAPSYSQRAKPRLESDGEGLASRLAYIAGNQPDDFDLLQELLRLVVPGVQRLRFERAPIMRAEIESIVIGDQKYPHRIDREYWGDVLVLDFKDAPNVPAHMASEGTLLVLGLLALVMGPGRPGLVLWDDMDRGLHPKAQKHLVKMLRQFLKDIPELQIVATTHSPYLVDELRPKEVRLTSLREDGSVACAGLTEHPEFEHWRKMMSPGEFWSYVGERWVGERLPAETPS